MKTCFKISILAALIIVAVIMSGCTNTGSTVTTSQITATPTAAITTTAVPTPPPVATFIQSEKSKNTNTPITLKFSMSKIPVVNEETGLRVEVNSIFDAQGTSVKIDLPQNVELVRGSINKTLDLKANQPESFDTVIKFKQSGNYQLTALANKKVDQDNSWGDMGVFYLTIGDLQSNITTYNPDLGSEKAQPVISETKSPFNNVTTSESSTPITLKLTQSKIPLVNEENILRVEVNSIFNAPGTIVKITLPPDVELVRGSLEKNIDLQANAPESFETIIKFFKPGNFKITAVAHKIIDQENSWGDMDVLYLTIGEESSQITTYESNTYAEQAQLVSEEPRESRITTPPKYLNIVSTPGINPDEFPVDINVKSAEPNFVYSQKNSPNNNTAGYYTVTGKMSNYTGQSESCTDVTADCYYFITGKLSYYTKVGGVDPDYRDTENTLVPLSYAAVYIFDSTTGTNLGSVHAERNGEFSVACNLRYSHDVFPNSFYVVVYAYMRGESSELHIYEYRVVSRGSTLSGLTDVWSVEIGPFASTPTGTWYGWPTQDIGSWSTAAGSNSGHAFMLFQDLARGGGRLGWDTGPSTILWNPTSTDGNHYHAGGQIHLVGEAYKSADTPIHEFGHNYMWTKKGSWTNTCPSNHSISTSYNTQCAYTEGWADFLPLAANGNPVYTWASGDYENLETPTWGTPYWNNGDGVEGRVAGALWDMFDSGEDGTDVYQYPLSYTDTVLKQNPQFTFRSFWDTWRTVGYSENATESIYQNTINYRSTPPTTAAVGIFRDGVFYLKDATAFAYGLAGDSPVVGDWNGDGISDVGVYRGGVFYRNGADAVEYGLSTDTPVVGDWNGDGISDVGVYRDGVFYRNGADAIVYGISTDTPVVGDWNGDGLSEVGVFRGGVFYRNGADAIVYGLSTDTPVVGKWT